VLFNLSKICEAIVSERLAARVTGFGAERHCGHRNCQKKEHRSGDLCYLPPTRFLRVRCTRRIIVPKETRKGRAGVRAHRELQPGRTYYRKRRESARPSKPAAPHVNAKRIAIRHQAAVKSSWPRKAHHRLEESSREPSPDSTLSEGRSAGWYECWQVTAAERNRVFTFLAMMMPPVWTAPGRMKTSAIRDAERGPVLEGSEGSND